MCKKEVHNLIMDEQISRAEHEEFRKRLEERANQQNKRIEILEQSINRIESLNVSIEKLALNMESMLKEQVAQGKRLELLESRDGEKWRKVASYVLTAIIGIIIGFIFEQIGL